jgi:transcription antitermination factor NusG
MVSRADVFPWYAVRVRSNSERVVERCLRERGYELFLPIFVERRRWTDRIKSVEAPLFPGYVFCRLDAHNRLPVLSSPGVVEIVSQSRTPIPISEEEIVSVRDVVNSNLPYAPWPPFQPGQRVVVERGPLTGVQGILLETRQPCRLVVSIGILQRSVAVEINADWVRPCHPAPTGAVLHSMS